MQSTQNVHIQAQTDHLHSLTLIKGKCELLKIKFADKL